MLSCSQRSLQVVQRGILGLNLCRPLSNLLYTSPRCYHQSPDPFHVQLCGWVLPLLASSKKLTEQLESGFANRRNKREQVKHITTRVKWWFSRQPAAPGHGAVSWPASITAGSLRLLLLELQADSLVWFVADWPISIAVIGLIEGAWPDKGARCCRATRDEIVAVAFILSSPQSRVNGAAGKEAHLTLWNTKCHSGDLCCSASSNVTGHNVQHYKDKTYNKPQTFMFFPCQTNWKTFTKRLMKKAGIKKEHQKY